MMYFIMIGVLHIVCIIWAWGTLVAVRDEVQKCGISSVIRGFVDIFTCLMKLFTVVFGFVIFISPFFILAMLLLDDYKILTSMDF